MARIGAIHHPLRKIDSGAGDIYAVIHVGYLIDWPAVHTHAHPNLRMILKRSGNLHRAVKGLLRTLEKDKRHPVPTRDADQFSSGIALRKLWCPAHNLVELLQ